MLLLPGSENNSAHYDETKPLNHIWLFVTPWTVARPVPLSQGFSRQEYWSGLPFPPPGNFLDPEIKLHCRQILCCLNYQGDGASSKEPACQCKRPKRLEFDSWVRKIPWRRKWQPIPVFLPGESYGQRSLAGYSPWGGKESDTTEWLHTHMIRENTWDPPHPQGFSGTS